MEQLDLASADGGAPEVLRCLTRRSAAGQASALALVLAVDGSAYVGAGTLLLFGNEGRLRGWLSGGCLERHLEERASALLTSGGCCDWVELDQRDDAALLAPSASGCRSLLRILLLGAECSAAVAETAAAWVDAGQPLRLRLDSSPSLALSCGERHRQLSLDSLAWPELDGLTLQLGPAPRVLLLGAGAESPVLIPLLRSLGFRVEVVEQRPRWLPLAAGADRLHTLPVEAGIARCTPSADDAVLLMHHDFERDRAALAALAGLPPRWIGLLGPRRRRDDLFTLLKADARASLLPRLESPVGLHLGGKGPAAIALSIAASLQRWRHAG